MGIKTSRLKRETKKIIEDQPIMVHRFVLVDDGYSDKPSYAHAISWPFSWIQSWRGRIDTLGRETWMVMTSEAGTTAQRSFVLTLPYMEGGHPKTDDMIELYDLDGTKLGHFKVNMCTPNDWKTEVNVVLVAPSGGKMG